jgi:hemoglobin-like flavoprotein
MANNFDDLQQSYGRCLREKNFIERFYEIFLESHSSIRPMFEKTDFQTQRMALRHGISAAISYASGSSLTKRTMDQMADVHSRTGHAPVSPDLYPYWIESLVKTVKEVDPQASPALLARWREGMKIVTDDFSKRF